MLRGVMDCVKGPKPAYAVCKAVAPIGAEINNEADGDDLNHDWCAL